MPAVNFIRRFLERRRVRRAARALRKKADAFNRNFSMVSEFAVKHKGDGAWMCPDCGKVHKAFDWTMWTGAQYPECCRYFRGHRVGSNVGGYQS